MWARSTADGCQLYALRTACHYDGVSLSSSYRLFRMTIKRLIRCIPIMTGWLYVGQKIWHMSQTILDYSYTFGILLNKWWGESNYKHVISIRIPHWTHAETINVGCPRPVLDHNFARSCAAIWIRFRAEILRKNMFDFFGKVHLEGKFPPRWIPEDPPGGKFSLQVDFSSFF